MNRCIKPSQDTPESNTDSNHLNDPPKTSYNCATAVINLKAISSNANYLRQKSSQDQLLLAIKANAYGHGLVDVARATEDIADYFAVARLNEARKLREPGISIPIVVLSESLDKSNLHHYLDLSLIPCLFSDNLLEDHLNLLCESQLDYWLKINTGMNRLGISPAKLESSKGIFNDKKKPAVVLSHLSESENSDTTTTEQQLALFNQTLRCLEERHALPEEELTVSINNSAATLKRLDNNYRGKQINRCGISLYGSCHKPNSLDSGLESAMSLYAPIIDIRDVPKGQGVGYNSTWKAEKTRRIVTVAIGYGDGYPRHAPNGTPVLVNGQRAKLAGRVSMDMIGVDITDIDNSESVEIGDNVCLWGDGLAVEQIAELSQTISYQLLTGISSRVTRVYIE